MHASDSQNTQVVHISGRAWQPIHLSIGRRNLVASELLYISGSFLWY